MKLFILTVKFMYRNILPLFFLTLLPAIILALTFYHFNLFTYMTGFRELKIEGWPDIYRYITWTSLNWWSLPVFLIFIALLSFACTNIERKMRLGIYTFTNPFARINDSIIAVGLIMFTLIAILFIWEFLLSALLYLCFMFFSTAAVIYINVFLIIIMMALLITIFVPLLMWMPCMLTLGYQATKALSSSLKLTRNNFLLLALSIAFPFAILYPIDSLIVYIPPYFRIIPHIIISSVLLMYYLSLGLVAFYEITNTKRNDIKERKKYYYN